MPRVVIVGAGYGGLQALQALQKQKLDVTVIEPKTYFFHNIAAVRGAVDASFANKVTVPLDSVLSKSKHIQGNVKQVQRDHVIVERVNGSTQERVDFDYLIYATGSAYSSPFKSVETEASKAIAYLKSVAGKIQNANTIVVIGSGPVGIEVAGEIKALHPGKKVTIVTNSKELAPGPLYTVDFRKKLAQKLEKVGIPVVFNTRIENLPEDPNDLLQPTTLRTSSGTTIEADLVLKAIGSTLQNSSIKTVGSVLDGRGFVKVNEFLQVQGFNNIFCIGDVSTADTQKVSWLAQKQGDVAAKNVVAAINGKKLAPYKPLAKGALFVTVGPNEGAGQMPMGNFVVGSWMVKSMKGKDMFAKKVFSSLGQAYPN